MSAMNVEVFGEFSESVKLALSQFKTQTEEITLLKSLIQDLENKLLAIPEKQIITLPNGKIGFTDKTEAKHFVDLCKGIFLRDGAAVKDLTEGIDSEGGYLVPLEIRNTLIMMLNQYGVARPACTVIPIAREELSMPKLVNGVQVFWIGEGQTIPQTQPSFGEFRMLVKKLAAMVPVTSELLADSVIPIANLLATLFANALAKEEDRVIFTGSTIVGDPFNGVFGDPGVNSYVLPATKTKFTDITSDMLAEITSTLIPAAADGAKFYMHRTILNVVRTLKNSIGEYIYSPDIQPGTPGMLWGYPIVLSEVMPAIGASGAGKPFMIFGNMAHYYIGDRMALSVARSDHVGFAQDKVFLRIIQREALAAALPEAFIVIKTAAQ
jgi:HK97 family phage major capsid protein